MIGDILQPTHLLFVLVVALLVLGPKRLPEAGRALGKGLRDFKTAISGEDDGPSGTPNAGAPAPHVTATPVPAAAPPVEPTPAPADNTESLEVPAQPAEHEAETAHPVG